MPLETFSLDSIINVSLQVGDYIYFVNPRENKRNSNFSGSNAPFYNASPVLGGPPNINMPDSNNKPRLLGTVFSIDRNAREIEVEVSPSYSTWDIQPEEGVTYFLFSKDKTVNTSGIVGYFSETEVRNYTTKKAEIFTLNLDFVESSK